MRAPPRGARERRLPRAHSSPTKLTISGTTVAALLAVRPCPAPSTIKRPARRRQQRGARRVELGGGDVLRAADDQPRHLGRLLQQARAAERQRAVVVDRTVQRRVRGQRPLRLGDRLLALGRPTSWEPSACTAARRTRSSLRLRLRAAHGSFSAKKWRTGPQRGRRAAQHARMRDPSVTIPRTRSGASVAAAYVSQRPQSCPTTTARGTPIASSSASTSRPSVSGSYGRPATIVSPRVVAHAATRPSRRQPAPSSSPCSCEKECGVSGKPVQQHDVRTPRPPARPRTAVRRPRSCGNSIAAVYAPER